MRRDAVALLFLLLLACDGDPAKPPAVPAPVDPTFARIAHRIDWSRPELGAASAALAAGDSAAAAAELLVQLRAAETIDPPHQGYSNPVALADGLLAGVLSLPPHQNAPLPADPTWSEDPFGDSNWRFQYHSFRWSLPLLLAWQETGEEAYLDRLLFLMQDYAEDVLATTGPADMPWYDMSASLRLEHWLTIWRVLLAADRIDVPAMASFLDSFWIHGDRLANAVPYHWYTNHGTFHNRALFVLAQNLPQYLDAEAWHSLSFGRMEAQILALLSTEGVENEQAPLYHFYMLEIIPGLQSLLESAGLSLGPAALSRAEGMAPYAARILTPPGSLPMLGDTPESIALGSFLGLHAELDYAIRKGSAGSRPAERFACYPEVGTIICRSGWGQDRDYSLETQAVFDCGPRGSWHGHDDALTFCLTAWGQSLVVDSGFYTYNEDDWRAFFTSPAAHNVLVHADGDETGRSDTPQRLFWRTGADWAWQAALLDLGDGHSWIRHFIMLAPDDVLLIDRSSGPGGRALQLLFHFHPEAALVTDGAMIRLSQATAALDLLPLGEPQLSLVHGGSAPSQGWYSVKYGSIAANHVAVYSSRRGAEFTTLLHAHDGTNPLLGFTLEEDGGDGHYRFGIERQSGGETLDVWLERGELLRALR